MDTDYDREKEKGRRDAGPFHVRLHESRLSGWLALRRLNHHVHRLDVLLEALLDFHDAALLCVHLSFNLGLGLLELLADLSELDLKLAHLLGEVGQPGRLDGLLCLLGLLHLLGLLLLEELLVGLVLHLVLHIYLRVIGLGKSRHAYFVPNGSIYSVEAVRTVFISVAGKTHCPFGVALPEWFMVYYKSDS
ncbi:hypothetical protein [Paenibacillus mucilaginosus]|uniref:hypothetical protein n=1 Tax=Paenibacillus mucilaginosus TaxID=61624 RepID=UPI00165136E9|nr:hypothetical protein [Paenibacillus mucilaginosus]MCG7216757.1 hypothetical protein [Paenibacillus mucilaginosus]WDM27252.1 hypothetical protein KCX80_33505 [Paenibacillus mucilaginosus]